LYLPELRKRPCVEEWNMTAPIIHSIDDLKEWDRNPREITHQAQDGLATSLQEFGDLSGIVFNATLGALVSGHQRVETIRKKWGDQARVEGDRIILPTVWSNGIGQNTRPRISPPTVQR